MRSWAIVIGMDSYPGLSGQNPLYGAVADACDFAAWALDPSGGAVDPADLYFWTRPWPLPQHGHLGTYLAGALPHWFNRDEPLTGRAPPDQMRGPKAEEIVLTAEAIGNILRDAAFEPGAEPGRILVFLAGHGLRASVFGENKLQTCFIAEDFRPAASNMAQGLVPCDSFRRSLRNRRFEEVLLFLDCCRSDPQTFALKAMPLCDLTDDREDLGWSIGHASQESAKAYETAGPTIRGAFTKTMMDGLRGWRDPVTTSLNVEQLDSFVRGNIASATNSGQSPYFDFLPKNAPLIVVSGGPTIQLAVKPGPLVHLNKLVGGETLELLLNGTTPSVWHGGPYTAGERAVQLPPLPDGIYSLRVVGAPNRETLFRHPTKAEIDAP
ncbi:MAG: peptidase C14 caspase catalytic subunit p20 [Pseudorhodobacter sp. PARRP1]|nr:MAG: peptidase C14 caspase catalytic subunit p20 [Pseudorhodobacter sp. PARRP1]